MASKPALRVFVGTSPDCMDEEACVALEHSIRSRSSVLVDIERLSLSSDPTSSLGGWMTGQWATPWTALRWAVPEICGWSGRAVYFDCASLVRGDIAELGAADFPRGAFLLARREGRELMTGCLVFDCSEAQRSLAEVKVMKASAAAHRDVGALLERRPRLVAPLPGNWGRSDADFARVYSLVGRASPDGGSVHFPRLQIQPHGSLSDERLRRAGRAHWFRGARLPHYCARLSEMWRAEYSSAVEDKRRLNAP